MAVFAPLSAVFGCGVLLWCGFMLISAESFAVSGCGYIAVRDIYKPDICRAVVVC